MPGPHLVVPGLRALGLALGLLAGCATGGSPVTAPAPVPAPVSWGQEGDLAVGPLLWQVGGRGGGAVYLFGTMHSETAASVPPAVWERLRASRILALEADPTALSPPAILTRALLPPGESLDTLLGGEAWARLRDHLKDAVPEPALARMQPWVVVSLVLVKASGVKPSEETMDLALMRAAKDAGKPLRFLESLDEQIDLLARTFDAKALAELTSDLDALPVLLGRMSAAYRGGDVRGLEAVLTDRLSEDASRLVLGARNERWLPFLDGLVAEGGGLLAVGAGHLPGPGGLVALLRTRGYRVTRVPAAR